MPAATAPDDPILHLPLTRGPQRTACSEMQKLILKYADKNQFDNMIILLRATGRLDIDFLQKAVRTVVARHGGLRTRFSGANGDVYQEVVNGVDISFSIKDHSNSPNPLGVALESAWTERRVRFDPSGGILLRVVVFHLGRDDHLIAIPIDHIAGDGHSMVIISRELRQSYTAIAQGREPALYPKTPPQFLDYLQWEQHWLTTDEAARQLNYWAAHLQGLDNSHHHNMISAVASAKRTLEYDRHGDFLSAKHTLTEICRAHHIPAPFIVLFAAFALTAARNIARDDFVVNIMLSNRVRPETQGMVGYCANTLPFRVRIARQMTYRDFLHQTTASFRLGFDNQEIPFPTLCRKLKESRGIDASRLQGIWLNMPPAIYSKDHWGRDLTVERIWNDLDKGRQVSLDQDAWTFTFGGFVREEVDGYSATVLFDKAAHDYTWASAYVANMRNTISVLSDSPNSRLPDTMT